MQKRKLTYILMIMAIAGVSRAAYFSGSENAGPTRKTKINMETSSRANASGKGADMTVHFVDVGQGLGILVQSGEETLVYDGGDRATADLFADYLQDQGVESVDYMIASHYDADHIGGLMEVLDLFEVETVIAPAYEHSSNLYRNFSNAVSEEGSTVYHPNVGEAFEFGSGEFTVLSPEGISSDSNENSVVIKLENGENSFIFTGDAEKSNEQDMLYMDIDCDVLCLGHHGSSHSTSWEFLSATTPEYAVISCGLGNEYGHPHAETMEELKDMEIPIFRTDKQGTIVAFSNGEEISWNEEPSTDYSSGEDLKKTRSKSEEKNSTETWDALEEVLQELERLF